MTTPTTFTVSETIIQRIIYAASEFHNDNHSNCDYEVCDHPICSAAWQLEQEAGVFDEINGFLDGLDPAVLQGVAALIREKRKRTVL